MILLHQNCFCVLFSFLVKRKALSSTEYGSFTDTASFFFLYHKDICIANMFSFFQKTDPNEIKSLCCRATERIKLVLVVRMKLEVDITAI